jgi:hypothetical protein
MVESCFKTFKPDYKLTEADFTLIETYLDANGDGKIDSSELHAGLREWFPEVCVIIVRVTPMYVCVCVCVCTHTYTYSM